jgi:hypothetical protein
METYFALGIEVDLLVQLGGNLFGKERAKRLQRKARPAEKCPKNAEYF